jgi:hypothetical protein
LSSLIAEAMAAIPPITTAPATMSPASTSSWWR